MATRLVLLTHEYPDLRESCKVASKLVDARDAVRRAGHYVLNDVLSRRQARQDAATRDPVDELIELGVEQIVLVSAAPETPGPHALAAPRLDGRGRLGEYLQSSEAAIVRDATTTTGGVRIFTVRPVHNPIGPFDFSGGYDDRSQRIQGLAELMNRGYEDAYHQFIEPVVGASGDRVGGLKAGA